MAVAVTVLLRVRVRVHAVVLAPTPRLDYIVGPRSNRSAALRRHPLRYVATGCTCNSNRRRRVPHIIIRVERMRGRTRA